MTLESSFWQAISREQLQKHIRIFGSTSTSLCAFLLANHWEFTKTKKKLLVLVPDAQTLHKLQQDLDFFAPKIPIFCLEPYDVSPYSGLYPSHQKSAKRMQFYSHWLKNNLEAIFIASMEGFEQLTLPQASFLHASKQIQIGDELPDTFAEYLHQIGYQSRDLVEEAGSFSLKGGIIDLFSPHEKHPVRIELFGDQIESIRLFDEESQISLQNIEQTTIIPAREVFYYGLDVENLIASLRKDCESRNVSSDLLEPILHSLVREQYFQEMDFLLPYAYPQLQSAVPTLNEAQVWVLDPLSCLRHGEIFLEEEKKAFRVDSTSPILPPPERIYQRFEDFYANPPTSLLEFEKLEMQEEDRKQPDYTYNIKTSHPLEWLNFYMKAGDHSALEAILKQTSELLFEGYSIFFCSHTASKAKRIQGLLQSQNFQSQVFEKIQDWQTVIDHQASQKNWFPILLFSPTETIKLQEDKIFFITEDCFFGHKSRKTQNTSGSISKRADKLHFADLKPGDKVVHIEHGVGVFDGLKEIHIQGYPTELIQLSYKDNDKLYVPVYRIHQIQRYNGTNVLDKLGSKSWEKAKIKVKSGIKDIANELLQLYAKRAQMRKLPFSQLDEKYYKFEDAFPYEETEDQLTTIEMVLKDMASEKPMDRLVCGDVGFGKTEVAMRAAFKAFEDKRQVAVLVPTTILAFQHYESFQKRFKGWGARIRYLSRFTSNKDIKDTLQDLKTGSVDIVIGTHRLLSADVDFYNLGLLVIDEEHRFGVIHKEKIRKIKSAVDTLTMTATPIPRTLNMSLAGIRDLSLITTPPEDRLPTRTFISKFNRESIRKAVLAELERGGQIYFLHNRVQSIYRLEEELRELLPDVRIRVGHGQMKEDELENVMIAFFKHEFDVFLCTTIIESGLDNSRANTIFIDNAHQFGLSQLYQIRGRVGRSKERAYCYLLIPPSLKLEKDAQERLRILQENTALGSGFKIANYDLELRGAGNILGDEQKGHVNTVGYDLYFELLEQTLKEVRGEEVIDDIEPEINIPIPALIPDKFIQDIRTRLAYYKAMAEVDSQDEMSQIEEELKDQFGNLPDEVINLMGIMLIRKACKLLGVRDISATKTGFTLAFTNKTKASPQKVVNLAVKQSAKYRLTPDNRFVTKIEKLDWPIILQELENLQQQLI